MRWHLEEVFLAVRLDVLLGVDRKLLVRIHGDQHLTDVSLKGKFRFTFNDITGMESEFP